MIIQLGLLVLLPFLVECQRCTNNCWDFCFKNVSQPSEAEIYQSIYQIVMGVRSLYGPCSKPRGTVYMLPYMMPGTAPCGSVINMKFHTNLAKIIAMTQSVDQEENPFFVTKYYNLAAYYINSWQCRDKCNLDEAFDNTHMQEHVVSASMTNFQLGDQVVDRVLTDPIITCNKNLSKPLVIVFTGNNLGPSSSTFNKVVIGTDPSTNLDALSEWAYPGPAYQVKNTLTSILAVDSLASCIKRCCCVGNSVGKSTAALNQYYSYVIKEESTGSISRGTFSGTSEGFKSFINNALPKKTTTTTIPVDDNRPPNLQRFPFFSWNMDSEGNILPTAP